jgi:hypothetical protein
MASQEVYPSPPRLREDIGQSRKGGKYQGGGGERMKNWASEIKTGKLKEGKRSVKVKIQKCKRQS